MNAHRVGSVPTVGTMDTMRVFGIRTPGGPDRVEQDIVAVPEPTGHEVLVRVEAFGLNPVDAFFRSTPWEEVARVFPKQIPPAGSLRVLGEDVCGTVVAVGPDVTTRVPGEVVYGSANSMAAAGAHSEFAILDERAIAAAPASMAPADSVAFPMVGITVWESLVDILRIGASDRGARLLVIGGAGGTGSIAIQLASRYLGLAVDATAGSDHSADRCRSMGAETVFDHRRPLLEQTEVDRYPFILCTSDTGAHLGTMFELVAPYGHICTLVPNVTEIPVDGLRRKSASFGVEFMGLRQTGTQIERHGEILRQMTELIDVGVVTDLGGPRLVGLDLETVRDAHRLLDQGRGKVTVSTT